MGNAFRFRASPVTVGSWALPSFVLGVEMPELFGLSQNRQPTRLAYTLPGQPLLRVREALELLEAALDQVESSLTRLRRGRRKR